jgi:hypothetical protein
MVDLFTRECLDIAAGAGSRARTSWRRSSGCASRVCRSEIKDELVAIAARREDLQRHHAAITGPKPLLHPEMAAI